MSEKFRFMLEKSEYKVIEVEGTLTENGIAYNEPYITIIEDLQKDGWRLTRNIERVEL